MYSFDIDDLCSNGRYTPLTVFNSILDDSKHIIVEISEQDKDLIDIMSENILLPFWYI